jgi:hypothetical protein
VLPFCEVQGQQIEHILTGNGGRESCDRPMIHPYQTFSEFIGVEHRRTKVARLRTNGFVERLTQTVLDKFSRETFLEKFCASVEEFQANLVLFASPLRR